MEQLASKFILTFIVGYTLLISLLSGFYIIKHKWKEKSIPYLYACITSLITSGVYIIFLSGIVIHPTFLSSMLGRTCLILLLTAFLVFIFEDL